MINHDAISRAFEREGFAVLPGFRSAEQVAALKARALQIAREFQPEGRPVFTTEEQKRHADRHFLDSAFGVTCFYEEGAFDEQGCLRQAPEASVNKIGHALHDLDPVFEQFSHGADLQAVAQAVGLEQPQVWQSMVIFKPPHIGGEVRWHQDATFFDTTPQSVTAFWFALDDATQENGCLWVQPGGHRSPLRERFVREGDQVRMEPLDASPWPTQEQAVAVEVEAGTLVVFHGLLPHYSAPNRSDRWRIAYTLHATDARCSYKASNWLQRPAHMPVRGFTG
jgi:phytanoyl-CoA hydroxylase